jgi:uncharacterized protein (TIGR03382 family)
MKKTLIAAVASGCFLLSGAVFAQQADFHRTIHGNLFTGGNISGSFDYEFHYNIAPSHVQTIVDVANSPGHVQAYAPFSGFTNQFYANLTLYNTGGTPVQMATNMLINRFLVVNDVEFAPGQPHDAFEIDTTSALGDIQMTFFTLDATTLADVSLNAILIQDTFKDILAPANGRVNPMAGSPTNWGFSFGQASTVSGPIPDLPTPGTLPLVGLALGALAWARRRSEPVSQTQLHHGQDLDLVH